MSDPREKTLGEYARNTDGKTYNGARIAEWLFAATTGKQLLPGEAEQMISDAQKKAADRGP